MGSSGRSGAAGRRRSSCSAGVIALTPFLGRLGSRNLLSIMYTCAPARQQPLELETQPRRLPVRVIWQSDSCRLQGAWSFTEYTCTPKRYCSQDNQVGLRRSLHESTTNVSNICLADVGQTC